MNAEDVLHEIRAVLVDTFFDEDLEVSRSTTALDVPGWDSLSHTIVLLALEQRLNVHIPPGTEFENVGELVDCILLLQAGSLR